MVSIVGASAAHPYMQGAQKLRSEAQSHRWTFYETIKFQGITRLGPCQISFRRRKGLSVNRAPAPHLGFPSKKKGEKGKEGEAGLFLDTPFDWAKIKKTVRFPFADEKKTF